MLVTFYHCPICGNVVIMAVDSGIVPKCCGSEMQELEANEQDQGSEKHLPVVELLSDHMLKVSVGSMPHPMTMEHHISFLCLETDHGFLVRYLWHDDAIHKAVAEATLRYQGIPTAVYEYCNIHGLWKREVVPMHCTKGGSTC